MNSLELKQIINKDKLLSKTFIGIFAADELNFQVYKKPSCLIVNTDPATEPGEHWIAIYFDARGNMEYFDSFGRQPTADFVAFMKENGNKIRVHSQRLQSDDTYVCGMYCVYFLFYRVRNVNTMFAKFGKNLLNNDRLICRFMYSHFHVNHKVCY